MNFKYNIFFICALIISVISCSPDEDDNIVSVPENDRTEQQVIDNDSLVGYLNTHYYNSAEVNAMANPTISDVVITELLEDETLPSGTELLMSAAELKTTTYLDVEYEYYILRINQGIASVQSPRFCDKVRVKYAGSLLDGVEFEAKTTPVDFDLTGVISGWSRVMPEFNGGTFTTNSDGTVTYENYGMGVMFLPSGLGYYATYTGSIPSYSNLVFKFELLQSEIMDHDFDNIPSYMEVNEADYDLFGKDTDEDLVVDFVDSDDDGDGTPTADEVRLQVFTEDSREVLKEILDNLDLDANQLISPIKYNTALNNFTANLITLVDTNENGTPNYLDDTESERIE